MQKLSETIWSKIIVRFTTRDNWRLLTNKKYLTVRVDLMYSTCVVIGEELRCRTGTYKLLTTTAMYVECSTTIIC